LMHANERRAYALTDRGTWLAMSSKTPALRLLIGGSRLSDNRDQDLRNTYGVMVVNPDTHPGVKHALAERFVQWLLSAETQRVIGEFGVARFGQPLYYPDSDEYKATRELTVRAGGRSKRFTLADLRALPKVTLARHEVVGVKKGPLGTYSWTGASLKDVLLNTDQSIGAAKHAASRIVVTSSDGWTVTLWWQEIFGAIPHGLALYNVKGCNECHGVQAEGTSPSGKRPAPGLAGNEWPIEATLALLRAGRDEHAGLNPYTEAQMSRADLAVMLAWLKEPHWSPRGDAYRPPASRAASLLAYERDGRPLAGDGGLIQLIVGPDEFAGRYSHWVKSIEVVPPAVR
jgi:mono/diheme cytochrome c family protein